MKTVAIIGGGIAGLTAGIYLQKAGYQTEIYEKNSVPGGMCMGWRREGYTIDNCVHWLTGTKEGSSLNQLWKEVGVLGEGIGLHQKEMFFSIEENGEKLTFWRDAEKTRQEMLLLSPEDEQEINQLIDYVKLAESCTVPVDKPFDMMNPIEFIKMGASMAEMGKVMKEYGKISLEELGQRFRHPLISKALQSYMPPGYLAYALLVSYATVCSGNGDVPRGGSLAMALRMASRYNALGGSLHTNSNVERVIVSKGKAEGILLADGKKITADDVICACDTSCTFSRLLDRSYMPKALADFYANSSLYPVRSSFQIAFAIDGVWEELQGTQIFFCKSIRTGKSMSERMSISSYDYEPEFAPEGKMIVQSSFVQTGEDYLYWKELYQNKEEYEKKKKETAEEGKKRLMEKYPFLEGKVRVLDAWTPVTYHNYGNAYHGSYMGFIVTKGGKNKTISGKIKGLTNVFLASQWQMPPGGLPTAAAMGKFAAMRIMKKEGNL